MTNNKPGNGGGRGGKNKRFVPVPTSEWTNNQTQKTENAAPKTIKKPVTNQACPSPPAQYQPQSPSPQWSSFAPTQVNLELLQSKCHGKAKLEKAGYVSEELSERDLKFKLRCLKCDTKFKPRQTRMPKIDPNPATKPCFSEEPPTVSAKKTVESKVKTICFYHTGRVFEKQFSCCGQHMSQPGCVGSLMHEFPNPQDQTVQRNHQYRHTTPSQLSEPPIGPQPNKALSLFPKERAPRAAIALDCEMGVAANGDSELIRLTVVDVFTQEKLIDNLVKPSVKMHHLNTRFSGVTSKDLSMAEKEGNCFFGRDAARTALMNHVSPDTVVVVHGGNGDFAALRWIHPQIIDTFILYKARKKLEELAKQLAEDMREAEKLNMTVGQYQRDKRVREQADKLARAAGAAMMEDLTGVPTPNSAQPQKKEGAPGGLSLKALVKQHANIDVQMGKGKNKGHDSLEDALACRELVIRFIRTSLEIVDQASNHIANSYYGTKTDLGRIKRAPTGIMANDEQHCEKSDDSNFFEFVEETLGAMVSGDDEMVETILERLRISMARRSAA